MPPSRRLAGPPRGSAPCPVRPCPRPSCCWRRSPATRGTSACGLSPSETPPTGAATALPCPVPRPGSPRRSSPSRPATGVRSGTPAGGGWTPSTSTGRSSATSSCAPSRAVTGSTWSRSPSRTRRRPVTPGPCSGGPTVGARPPSPGRPCARPTTRSWRARSRRCVTCRLTLGGEEHHLVRERARLESAVRSRYRRLRAGGTDHVGRDLDRLSDRLGETTLLCVAIVRGSLVAVTVADGRARLQRLGDAASVEREATYARFALRRAAYGRAVDVSAAGQRLQDVLLGTPDPAW